MLSINKEFTDSSINALHNCEHFMKAKVLSLVIYPINVYYVGDIIQSKINTEWFSDKFEQIWDYTNTLFLINILLQLFVEVLDRIRIQYLF